jgi:ubiquinone/menaquinone biosynthesis C-methylase UbiE
VEPKLHRWVQRRGWDHASTCYERYWGPQLQPVIDLVIDVADVQPGEHVLDVACGTGMVSLPVAAAVGPVGHVLATDLSPRMVSALRQRARDRRLDNLDVQCIGAEHLDLDGSFDVALCSLGLMYVPSPLAAAYALHRALRSGGRAVVSVWGERRNCGWAELFPIVDAQVASDVCPYFFGLGAPGALAATLTSAGFADATETRLRVDLCYAAEADALGAAFRGGPVALAYSRFDDHTRRTVHEQYLASIAGFADGPGFRVPGEFVVCSATRSPRPTALTGATHYHSDNMEGTPS